MGRYTGQSIYYSALKKSGVRRKGGIHLLRHSVCHAPHGKRRRTTSSAALAGPFEPKDYGALPPCDGTQASRSALTFGSHRQRLHRTVSAHTEITLANPPPGRTDMETLCPSVQSSGVAVRD